MLQFILKRLGLVIPTFIGITLLTFAFVHMIPGDPVMIMAGERGISPERHAQLLALFGREEASAPSPEQHWETQATLQVFNQLPDEQRALILLVSVEGLSYQQTAETLGIPIGTVMSRLSRARQALRDLNGETPTRPAMRRLK